MKRAKNELAGIAPAVHVMPKPRLYFAGLWESVQNIEVKPLFGRQPWLFMASSLATLACAVGSLLNNGD